MRHLVYRTLGPLIGLCLFVAALWVLHDAVAQYHYRDIVAAINAIPAGQIMLALALTVISYWILTGYDLLAVRYIGRVLPWSKFGFAAALSYAFSNTLGLSVLVSGSMRYRLYSAWGLAPMEVAKLVMFNALTLWLGLLTVGGGVLLFAPLTLPAAPSLPPAGGRLSGALLFALPAAYMLLSLTRRRPMQIRGWMVDMPAPRLAAAQLLVGGADWLLVGVILYVLLPAGGVGFFHFLGIFVVAQTVGLLSHVPGGLGVFESVVLLLVPATMPAAPVIGALLAYRLIYYLLPLSIATAVLGIHEGLRHRERMAWLARAIRPWLPALLPQVFAMMALVCGAVLLFSGVTPAVSERMHWVRDLLPLAVVESSHFIASLAGAGLMLLARGLQRRIDAAWLLTVMLLIIGIMASLLKGGDYEEGAVLALLLASLIVCRRHFYRRASLTSQRFTAGWVATIVVVLACTVWLAEFSYKHVEYSNDLWWRFSFTDEGAASRALRAMAGATGLLLLFALRRLLRLAPPAIELPDERLLEQVRSVVAASRNTSAHLALLGDKHILLNEAGNGFVMYGIEGRTWVAMGDPVGPDLQSRELAWRFRELVEHHGGWTVFYQVRPETLELYLELGLTLLKIGEEARVPLGGFSLEGKERKALRGGVHRLEREGCRFEVLPPAAVTALLPALRAVSAAWLGGKAIREKGFSLGFFKEEYLTTCPIAVVRRGSTIIAFANLLLGHEKEELSVDLMRHIPEAPNGVMDYLFVHLMRWGKDQGYGWFNLGMAPLAGLQSRSLAPIWSRFGALVFGHGERFYNFHGLRQYKDKFDPQWESRYLAVPNAIVLPPILVDLAALIAGGKLKGLIGR